MQHHRNRTEQNEMCSSHTYTTPETDTERPKRTIEFDRTASSPSKVTAKENGYGKTIGCHTAGAANGAAHARERGHTQIGTQ